MPEHDLKRGIASEEIRKNFFEAVFGMENLKAGVLKPDVSTKKMVMLHTYHQGDQELAGGRLKRAVVKSRLQCTNS